jgi:hypothetical protein
LSFQILGFQISFFIGDFSLLRRVVSLVARSSLALLIDATTPPLASARRVMASGGRRIYGSLPFLLGAASRARI